VFQGVRDWGGSRIGNNQVKLVSNESLIYEKWYLKAAEIGLNSAETMDLSMRTGICTGNFVEGYVVYPDCSVHKCTLAYYNKETREDGQVGHINSSGLLSVDYNKIMKWMVRDAHNDKCLNCVMYPICKGGACPYSSNFLGKPVCNSSHCSELYALVKSKIKCLNYKNLISEYKGE
jgi:radical SAM protein with 4Fe4S-binding SPASM domain